MTCGNYAVITFCLRIFSNVAPKKNIIYLTLSILLTNYLDQGIKIFRDRDYHISILDFLTCITGNLL